MTDTELDDLLDAWKAPAAAASLRAGLRDRFPRGERRRPGAPLRWALVAVVAASATLAVATDQRPGSLEFLALPLRRLYFAVVETRLEAAIMTRIRDSNPQVSVDGRPAPPPRYVRGASILLDVPGDGAYMIVLFHPQKGGWSRSGRIHGNTLEFQAGGRQVRIVCNQPLVDADRAVFTRRQP